jgi:aminoglycoside 6-adenylyltransferase
MCKNFIGVPAMRAAIQQTSLAETKMSLLNILMFYRIVSEQFSRDQEMMRPIMITKIYQQFNDWLSV